MSLMVLQLILICGFVACIGLMVAGLLWVTARRPADDRDAFIRNLPPPSQPLDIRASHLRLLLRQQMIKYAKIDAVVGGVLTFLGVSVAVSNRVPIGVSVLAIAIFVVPLVVLLAIFIGLYLLARYRGAMLRLRNDVMWHPRPRLDTPPSTASTDTEYSSESSTTIL